MDVKLLLLHKGQLKKFSLKSGKLSIGRAPDSDLRIPSRDVSRHHCEFLIDAGDLIVHDTGSTNGTIVNGKAVDETELEAGDRVDVGPVTFIVQIDGQPAEVSPADFGGAPGAPAKAAPRPPAAKPDGLPKAPAAPAAKPPSTAKPAAAKPRPAADEEELDLPPGLLEDDEDTEELLDLGDIDLELDEDDATGGPGKKPKK
jgi:predicted component of type VI protein secretion system